MNSTVRKVTWWMVCAAILLVFGGFSEGAQETPGWSYGYVYYGHLHNHCNFSDGQGTVEEAYTAAQVQGLDFFSLADHGYYLTDTEYTLMKTTADNHNQAGVFTTFWGFEWTHSPAYGHVAVIGCDEFTTYNTAATDTFAEFMAWLDAHECVAFFNHPGRGASAATEFENFVGAFSDKIVGMELWNKTSLFSTYYYNSGYVTPDTTERSGYFDEAQLNGWMIGASGSEDNHTATWGQSPRAMAVLANTNTRAEIYAALQARRFYSTLDRSLKLSFEVDGQPMGSQIAGGSNTCIVKAADGEDEVFTKIEIIHNGTVVCTESPNQANPEVSCVVSTQQGDYIYCKVTQSDGDEAISSPVFVVIDGPPQASLIVPEDNGADDLNSTLDQVLVNTEQAGFQVQLTDFDGIDDLTVTADTVSLMFSSDGYNPAELLEGTDYFFFYDTEADVITLAAPVAFINGIYGIVLCGGDAKIADVIGNQMDSKTLTVEIDTSIVPPQTVSFQQGADSYTEASDTMLHGAYPTTSYSTATTITADASDGGPSSQVLVRFNNIIGAAIGQIPPGAIVQTATLRLRSLDSGTGGQLHAMKTAWTDASTWNTLDSGVQADDVEASSVADDGITTNSPGVDVDLDVAATVQAWIDGTLANNGWVVLPRSGTTDGWDIASAEYGTVDYRPELTVTFIVSDDARPVADDQTVTTDEDSPVAITLTGSDPDEDPLFYAVATPPAHGALTGDAPDLTYTPDADYDGSDSFTFTVNDGLLTSEEATVSITMNPVDDPPTANDDTAETDMGVAVNIDVLDNDDDIDGPALSIVSVTDPAGGSVETDGLTVTYTPDPGFSGQDTFDYTIAGGGPSDTATVTVDVAAVDYDAYVAVEPTATYGTVTGTIAGTTTAGDGVVQTVDEVPNGPAAYSMQVEYVLNTQADPANISQPVVINLVHTWTGGTTDVLAIELLVAGQWDDITGGIADGQYEAAAADIVDAQGDIRIRFSDTLNKKKEAKDTLTIDLLYAQIVAGPPDTTPPAAPQNLTATGGQAQISLDWDDNTDADLADYVIYRSLDGSSFAEIAVSSVSSYTDAGLGEEVTYYYVVKARDTTGNLSDQSNTASATTLADETPPSAPTGLTAVAGDAQVSLDWNNNTEPDLNHYIVYRSDDGGQSFAAVGTVAQSDYLDTGLTNGVTYYYVVSAVDASSNESAPSSQVSATPQQQTTQDMQVASIVMGYEPAGKNYKATATVTVTDSVGTPLAGATVTGDWFFNGSLIATGSGATDGTGTVMLISTPEKVKNDTFTLVITAITLDGYTYTPPVPPDQGEITLP